MYCVFMGDIVNSRKNSVSERKKVSDCLSAVLDHINTKFQDSIVAPFAIVRGDAFEGVLNSQHDSLYILNDIIRMCWEGQRIALRICMVIDELSIVDSNVNRADGPAFHRASDEIDNLRENRNGHWFQVSIITKSAAQPLIDGLLALLSELTCRWTEKQREIVWCMSDYSTQKELAEDKQLAPSVLSRQLKAAGYNAYIKAWTSLERYFTTSDKGKLDK